MSDGNYVRRDVDQKRQTWSGNHSVAHINTAGPNSQWLRDHQTTFLCSITMHVISSGLLAIALAVYPDVAFAQNSTNTTAVLANLERFWSYGRSAPVYPTPQGAGLGEWADSYSRAKALVAQMTNDEKNNITYGMAGSVVGVEGILC